MNTKKKGYKFEKEIFPWLKNHFDKVIWNSKKSQKTSYDFTCWKKRKKYLVDAKYRKNRVKTLTIPYSQRNADYIVIYNGGKIELWGKIKISSVCNIMPKTEKIRIIKNLPHKIFQIRKHGNSAVIVLTKEDLKLEKLKVGDVIEIDIEKKK